MFITPCIPLILRGKLLEKLIYYIEFPSPMLLHYSSSHNLVWKSSPLTGVPIKSGKVRVKSPSL